MVFESSILAKIILFSKIPNLGKVLWGFRTNLYNIKRIHVYMAINSFPTDVLAFMFYSGV